MAATASNRLTESRNPEAPRQRHADGVREVFIHAARIQLASITAAGRFFAGWAQAADRYAQTVSDELLGRVQGETDSSQLLGRLAAATGTHLREVTALPSGAVRHFDSELARTAKPRRPQP